MRHANSGAALARSSGQTPDRSALGRGDRDVTNSVVTMDRLTPLDLDLEREARGVWATVFDGVNVLGLFGRTRVYHRIAKLTRSGERYCPLEALAELVVWCANRRIPEARVRLVLVWLEGIIASVYAGKAHGDLDELDLEETDIENHENTLSWRRRIRQSAGGMSSRDELEAEALVNEQEAAVSIARARELRRRARQLAFTAVATTRGGFA